MKSRIPKYTIRQYGDYIKLTWDEIADETKIEEAKQQLIQQALMVARKLVETNIKFYIDKLSDEMGTVDPLGERFRKQYGKDCAAVVGWIMPFAVKNGGESIEWARGKNE